MSTHVDNAFKDLDNTMAEMQGRRNRLISIMEQGLDQFKLDPDNNSPRVTEVKLALLKTLDDLYKGQESASMSKVKLALSRVDTQTNQSIGAVALEMIKKIEMCDCSRFSGANGSPNVDDDNQLEAAAKSAGIEVGESETGGIQEQKLPDAKIDKHEFDLEEE